MARPRPRPTELSRRERQIMDVLYRLDEATVGEVAKELPDRPDYNAIRVTLGILEKKGVVTHRDEGNRYVYRPKVSREVAGRNAATHVMKTFFAGSPARAVLSLLDSTSASLTREELDDIAQWVERIKARKRRQ